jgi:hypothetical protein
MSDLEDVETAKLLILPYKIFFCDINLSVGDFIGRRQENLISKVPENIAFLLLVQRRELGNVT